MTLAIQRLAQIADMVQVGSAVAYRRGQHAKRMGWARIAPYDDFRDKFWLAGFDGLPKPEL